VMWMLGSSTTDCNGWQCSLKSSCCVAGCGCVFGCGGIPSWSMCVYHRQEMEGEGGCRTTQSAADENVFTYCEEQAIL